MIKLFLCDVDSTLTNGIYYTDENGCISKGFFSRDFQGMYVLHETGVDIGIITYARDKVIVQQCNRAAKYAKILTGARNKLEVVRKNYVGNFCAWDEIAYIGDDIMDAELLNKVGIAACPCDSHDKIKTLVSNLHGFQSVHSGGRGAVREFADYVDSVNKS